MATGAYRHIFALPFAGWIVMLSSGGLFASEFRDSATGPRRLAQATWYLCTPLNFTGGAKCTVLQNSTCQLRQRGPWNTKQEACDAATTEENSPYCVNGTTGC
jgi:hypothetical protein